MVDTHAHLDACEEAVESLIERAREAGVNRVLAIGMNGESCRHALEAADAHEEVYVSVGRHPHESADFDGDGLAELEQLAAHAKVRAIGETGLDYHRDYTPRDDQRRAFEQQIALANQLRLPLVIHTREAEDDTFDVLADQAGELPVIIHCFSPVSRVDECIERGYYCSFAGNVTYPKAIELHDAARLIPEELLLVETDAPFLAPQARRGKRNEPSYVTATAAFLAELRETSYERTEEILEANAARVFRW